MQIKSLNYGEAVTLSEANKSTFNILNQRLKGGLLRYAYACLAMTMPILFL